MKITLDFQSVLITNFYFKHFSLTEREREEKASAALLLKNIWRSLAPEDTRLPITGMTGSRWLHIACLRVLLATAPLKMAVRDLCCASCFRSIPLCTLESETSEVLKYQVVIISIHQILLTDKTKKKQMPTANRMFYLILWTLVRH